MKLIPFVKERIFIEMRRAAKWRARQALRANSPLWHALQEYIQKTKSTGCNYTDYWHLYRYVRIHKPVEILECGTGVSTVVIAFALMENEREREETITGRVTSMEEHENWLGMSRSLLPPELHKYVDFHLSPIIEDYFSVFRGVRYRDLPPRDYDFVFVDGPTYVAPSDSAKTFNFDLIHILRHADKPVAALVDKRVSTCYVLQQLLGQERVRYSPVVHLGFVQPSTRFHLREIHPQTSSLTFVPSYRLLGRTSLALCDSGQPTFDQT